MHATARIRNAVSPGLTSLLLALAILCGCDTGKKESEAPAPEPAADPPKQEEPAPEFTKSVQLYGSGASSPHPIFSQWFKNFTDRYKTVTIDYHAKGSSAGVLDFIHDVVNFAGSDAAMTDEEMAQATHGLVLLPVTAGKIVLAFNLPGVEELYMPRKVYTKIFLGEITKWNDPQIAAANPDIDLPDLDITLVTRSDASGTSYVFTGHLSAISEEFRNKVGPAITPSWPSEANIIKAPKNDGVSARISQKPGAIGYLNYGYAKLTGLPVAKLENRAGTYIDPGLHTGAAALVGISFPNDTLPASEVPDLVAWTWDPEDVQAYPITNFSWLIIPTEHDNSYEAEALNLLVNYMLSDEAQALADELGYIPLPEEIRAKAREAAKYIR
ncbi:phosphate ABC transporter substrate-binding protein PstS [Microbulbifer sp. TYP-18]|uniref:phosphate ABC transporter substrate-binding protein PstS n=1 Tax=Microbulbifer sp. TYP-18 TaxID=3230024 RepID=UPI0034C666FD